MVKTFFTHIVYWLRYYGADYNFKTKKFILDSRFGGILGLSALQWMNFVIILTIIQLYTDFSATDLYLSFMPDISERNLKSYAWIFLIYSPFLVINYFIICHGGTTKEMDSYFDSLSKEKLKKSKIMFFIYVALTFILFFYFADKKHDQDEALQKPKPMSQKELKKREKELKKKEFQRISDSLNAEIRESSSTNG